MAIKKYFCLSAFLFIFHTQYAQYTVNGNAAQISCNEYRLTAAQNTQTGSVWNNIKIDLNQSFDFNFDIFLGSNNSPGADGIAFVLQPISTSVGTSGSGLGYEGIMPAVGVTIDTYQNSAPDNDPAYDHIAFQLNGDLNHNSTNNIAGPVTALNGNDNIEDGNWHSLRLLWDAVTNTLTAYVDGSLRLTFVKDLVTDIFSGDPMVFWGFTGSTGGENNYQGFKTALNPSFHFSASQKRCVHEPITFYDSTITFTPLAKFWWDFGDGSPIDSVNLNPVHTYTVAGDYTVIQKVRGADGCEATNTVLVRIGSKPVADFIARDTCINSLVYFTNTSNATVGTINNWYWDFDNGLTSTIQHPSSVYTSNGNKSVKLAVKSLEGCESDTLIKFIYAYARPVVDFTFTDSVCLGTPTFFYNNSSVADGIITGYGWVFQDTAFPIHTINAAHIFLNPGNNPAILSAISNYNCYSLAIKNVFVLDKPTAYFKNNAICLSVLTTLTDSSYTSDGTAVTQWWWDLGNGQFSTQQNPSTIYNTAGPITVKHVVTNSKGCISDTLTQTIHVSAKPTANFGFSNPLCTGLPVQFSDSSVVGGGVADQWSWIYNGVEWSTQQNPIRIFTSGSHTVKLVATSDAGCISDTVSKTFFVSPSPQVSFAFNDACKNDTVSFTAIDNSGTVTGWRWDFGDGGISNSKDTQYVYSGSGIYRVKLFATTANGCYNDSLQKNIIIYGTHAFAGNDTITPSGRPLQLQASGGVNYEWTPSTGLNDPNIANPIAILTGTQTYTYTVRAYTPMGCESFDDITIQVYQAPEIYLPNAFTPNGDGLNDLYKGKPIGIRDFKFLQIFNRFGEQVFYTTDHLHGWDGTFKGKQQNSGVYVVIARGFDYRGLVVERQGTVILIR